jgi:hypothetical protein
MSSEIEFKRGEFQAFRAVTKVHIGAIGDDLQENEVVLFDGQTMRRGPEEHQVANLKGAIKIGWLVPEEQEGGSYRPQPADIQVHAAQSQGNKGRGEGRRMTAAADEERDVGNRETIRKNAANRDNKPGGNAPTGAKIIEEEEVEVGVNGQEGKVVGKFKNSAQAAKVTVGKDDQKIIAQIEKTEGVAVVKKARATGDVQEARSGDDVEELLPEAASSKKPAPGIAGEGQTDEEAVEAQKQRAAEIAEQNRQERLAKLGKATVSSGDKRMSAPTVTVSSGDKGMTVPKATTSRGSTPVGGAEDGEVIATVGKTSTSEESEGKMDPAIIQAKIEMIQQFVPGFQWDMNLQWRQRVKKALEFKNNMPVLQAILSLETPAVRKHVLQGIYGE